MKQTPSDRKLRGGYYTPAAIADFLARWAICRANDRVLEPSCGDGEIACAAARRLAALRKRGAETGSVTAIEIEAIEAAKTRRRLNANAGEISTRVINDDFFEQSRRWAVGAPLFAKYDPFDAVIGNPPFIRYQNFPERQRDAAFGLMEQLSLHPNRLTNAWVPFVVLSAHLLGESGRLAMVVPSELLQVSYAAETRQFLSQYFDSLTLVTFRDLLFDGIQQDTVLLLGVRRSRRKGIAVFELGDSRELEGLDVDGESVHPIELRHDSEKWLQYFLQRKQIELLRSLKTNPDVSRFSDFGEVDVGLVTGENSFFVLSRETTDQMELWPNMARLVSRSAHVQGLRFAESDWEACLERQERVLLFCPPDEDLDSLPPSAARYIAKGQKQGFNSGYKCRIRKRWWVVPSFGCLTHSASGKCTRTPGSS